MKINFDLAVGLRLEQDMPEELKKSLKDFCDNEGGKYLNAELNKIVQEYAKEAGIDIAKVEHTKIKGSNPDEVFDKLKELNTSSAKGDIEAIFSKLGEEKKKTESRDKLNTDLEDVAHQIHELVGTLRQDSTEEEKSLMAFNILNLKVKAEIHKMDASQREYAGSVTHDSEVQMKLDAIMNSDTVPEEVKIQTKKALKDYKRIESIIGLGKSRLESLFLISEEEYKDLNHNQRSGYLKNTKTEMDGILAFTEEEMTIIQSKFIGLLGNTMNLGDHMSIIL